MPLTSFAAIIDASGTAYRNNVASPNVADQFVAVFGEAGLAAPTIIWECLAGNWQSPIVNWAISSYASLQRFAADNAQHELSGEPQDLLLKVQADLRAVNAQVMSRPQVCAWAVKETS